MTIKKAVYAGFGFLIFIIVFILLISGKQQKAEIEKTISGSFPAPAQKARPRGPAVAPDSGSPKPTELSPAPSFSSLFEESLFKPIFLKPAEEIREFIKPKKEETFLFSPLSKAPSLEGTVSTSSNEIQQIKPPGLTALTPEREKEIFKKLYPDYFTDALLDIQNVFIEFGYLGNNYQKIEKFDTEEEIFSFMNVATDVFEKQGWYTKEEAEKFRRGTNEVWKNLMEQEKLDLQRKLIKSDFYKNIFAKRIDYFKHAINRKFLSLFWQLLKNKFVLKAYADSVGDSPGSCWESGPVKPGGANVKALCCDCGIKCGSKTCWYVHHCGPDGEQCDIQLGCLNKIAGTGDNPAIWDPETGICGVG